MLWSWNCKSLAGCAMLACLAGTSAGQDFAAGGRLPPVAAVPPSFFAAAEQSSPLPLVPPGQLRTVDYQNAVEIPPESNSPSDLNGLTYGGESYGGELYGGKSYGEPFCCNGCPPWQPGFYAAAEAVIVKPYFEDEVDTVRTIVIEPGEIIDMEVQLDPDYDHALTPRVIAGYRWCSGLGVRGRYWVFDQSAIPLSASETIGTVFATETLAGSLNVRVADAEFTKMLACGAFKVELGGGVRYGKVEMGASATDTFLLSDGSTFSQTTLGNSNFEGVGPTAAIEARHCLGHSPFAVVGNLRGSLLFGQTLFYRAKFDSSAPDNLAENFVRGSDDVVPVLESQVGIEYSKQYRCGVLSARVAMEAQWWGVATPGAGLAAELNQPLMRDELTTDRDLGFFGVAVGIGYNW